MSELQNKYATVISTAQSAGISDLNITEQDGILYISANTNSTAEKDKIWNSLGIIDPTYSSSDINLDIKIAQLNIGSTLIVATQESNLNLRQNPSTEGIIIGKASKGDAVTLLEQTSDDWWKIKNKDGLEGYAYSRYLKI